MKFRGKIVSNILLSDECDIQGERSAIERVFIMETKGSLGFEVDEMMAGIRLL